MEIVSGIYQIKVPIPDNPLENLNCYLIEGDEGWLMLVDLDGAPVARPTTSRHCRRSEA
jgi:hypothetical protein